MSPDSSGVRESCFTFEVMPLVPSAFWILPKREKNDLAGRNLHTNDLGTSDTVSLRRSVLYESSSGDSKEASRRPTI